MIELRPEDIKRRDEVCKKIPEGEMYTTCLIRRRKTKSGKDRFYIYNSNDQLEIAAECDIYKDCNFTVSLESIEFSKESPYKIAELIHRRYDTFYFAQVFQGGTFQKYMVIKFLSHYQKKSRKRKIQIEFEPISGINEILIQADDFNESYRSYFPDLCDKIESSSKNFLITSEKGNLCFSLAKMYKDEFHLAISSPLSILDGFLIALSTFHILKNE